MLSEGIEERENIETVQRFSNRTRIEIRYQTLFLVGINAVGNRVIELLYELLPGFPVSFVSPAPDTFPAAVPTARTALPAVSPTAFPALDTCSFVPSGDDWAFTALAVIRKKRSVQKVYVVA